MNISFISFILQWMECIMRDANGNSAGHRFLDFFLGHVLVGYVLNPVLSFEARVYHDEISKQQKYIIFIILRGLNKSTCGIPGVRDLLVPSGYGDFIPG